MYFSQNQNLREMEKLMQRIPNFRPRGYGVIAIEVLEIPPPTFGEVMAATVSSVKCPDFLLRLNEYIKESERTPMDYRNEKHRTVFEDFIQKRDKNNKALMSALYLLTADFMLWRSVKYCVVNNVICFEQIRLHGTTASGYPLFCAAKDLYLGTGCLTVSDLGDKSLVPPKVFGLICNAMAIRRFGLSALGTMKRGGRQ